MKMISRSKNNRGRNRTIVIGALSIALLAILILSGLFSKTFYGTMVALTGVSSGAGQTASSFSSVFSSKSSLEKENADLLRQLEEKDVLLADQALLAKENADLKAAVHLKEDTGKISVTVLSKPPFTPFDVVVIDAGREQGIKEGLPVTIGRIYIGTVTSVDDTTSRITLLSSPGSTHEAFIGDDALPVVLNGKGGGNFKTSLPLGSPVSEGDIVTLYHGNTSYQVGTVSKTISDEDNTMMTILLTMPFNLYSLSHVEI